MDTLSLETVRQRLTEFDEHLGASATRLELLRAPDCVCIHTAEGHAVDWDTRLGTAYGIRYRWPRPDEERGPITQDEAEAIAREFVSQHYPDFCARPLEVDITDHTDHFPVFFWEFCPENGARSNSMMYVGVRKRDGRVFWVNYYPRVIPDTARVPPAFSPEQAVMIARRAASAGPEVTAEARLMWAGPEARIERRGLPPPSFHNRLSWHVGLSRRTRCWKSVILDAMTGEVLLVSGSSLAEIPAADP